MTTNIQKALVLWYWCLFYVIIIGEDYLKKKEIIQMIIEINEELHEAKFNYYALRYANEQLEKRAKALRKENKDDSITLPLIGIYSSIVVQSDIESIVDIMEFMFSPKQNAGVGRSTIEEYLGSIQSEDEVDELKEEILSELEESGFFVKEIRQFNRTMSKLMESQGEMKNLTIEETIELEQYKTLLERANDKELI